MSVPTEHEARAYLVAHDLILNRVIEVGREYHSKVDGNQGGPASRDMVTFSIDTCMFDGEASREVVLAEEAGMSSPSYGPRWRVMFPLEYLWTEDWLAVHRERERQRQEAADRVQYEQLKTKLGL